MEDAGKQAEFANVIYRLQRIESIGNELALCINNKLQTIKQYVEKEDAKIGDNGTRIQSDDMMSTISTLLTAIESNNSLLERSVRHLNDLVGIQ